jgi:hypothetical protein
MGDDTRQKEWQEEYKKNEVFNFCPITRSLIQQYLALPDLEDTIIPSPLPLPKPHSEADYYKVFICYNSQVQSIADNLYNYLTNKNIATFYSKESISIIGDSDFSRVIEKALESALCMIVIGAEPEHFHSGWVDLEWRCFLNEMISGRKPKQANIFTFTSDNVGFSQLGAFLGKYQRILYTQDTLPQAFEKAYQFVRAAIQ